MCVLYSVEVGEFYCSASHNLRDPCCKMPVMGKSHGHFILKKILTLSVYLSMENPNGVCTFSGCDRATLKSNKWYLELSVTAKLRCVDATRVSCLSDDISAGPCDDSPPSSTAALHPRRSTVCALFSTNPSNSSLNGRVENPLSK